MSNQTNTEHQSSFENSSKRHLFAAVVALVAFPLLPAVMGLYNLA